MRTERDIKYDALLAVRWQAGDPAALNELLARWDRRLLYYVRRLVDSEQDAWDALQQTWLQVVRKLSTLRDTNRLAPWLYTIARNAALVLRRQSATNDKPIENEPAREIKTPDPECEFDDVEVVHYALAQLSPPHREALTLFFLQDLSIEEIAQVVGVSPGTIKSRIHYAKRQIREILVREGAGHG